MGERRMEFCDGMVRGMEGMHISTATVLRCGLEVWSYKGYSFIRINCFVVFLNHDVANALAANEYMSRVFCDHLLNLPYVTTVFPT
jgi:hypothetical protein